ncbi:MAG: LysR family transcriptional regulator [Acidimicrobiia bacterium]|nr:LysR family transcriptional regulator [Acidimicrobiia bacterium]
MSLQLTTQQLEYLVAATRAPSSADAAQSLGVTPSALSQGLTELERRLGLPLFEREGRSRVLTSYGREVLDYAQRIVGLTSDLAQWAEAAQKGETGRVSIGLIDVAAVHHFASSLTRFRRSRPDADLHLTVDASAALVEQVRSGRLDAAVVVEPVEPVDGIVAELLLTEKMAVYPPPDITVGHPSTWGPWVAFPASSYTRRLVTRSLRAVGATYDITAESHQPDVLRRMVAIGLGWAVLPVIQAETEPAPLKRARAAPVWNRRLVIVRRERSAIGPATGALLDLLVSHAASTGAASAVATMS